MKALGKGILADPCVFAIMLSIHAVFAAFDIPMPRGNRALGWLCIIAVAVLIDRWIEEGR